MIYIDTFFCLDKYLGQGTLAQSWQNLRVFFRCFYPPLPHHAGGGGDASPPAGTCSWTEAQGWSCRCLEEGSTPIVILNPNDILFSGAPGSSWCWLWFNCSGHHSGMLLQCYHSLVYFLPGVILYGQ